MRRFTISILFAACLFQLNAQERLIILNEGNWQSNNARISYFEDGRIVSNKWFEEANGYGIGDTPNDIIQVGPDLIAIAVNWSNIIQYIRTDGTAVTATEDVPNNRKMATDGEYLYITSYGHECSTIGGLWECTKGFVAKVDLKTFYNRQNEMCNRLKTKCAKKILFLFFFEKVKGGVLLDLWNPSLHTPYKAL